MKTSFRGFSSVFLEVLAGFCMVLAIGAAVFSTFSGLVSVSAFGAELAVILVMLVFAFGLFDMMLLSLVWATIKNSLLPDCQ